MKKLDASGPPLAVLHDVVVFAQTPHEVLGTPPRQTEHAGQCSVAASRMFGKVRQRELVVNAERQSRDPRWYRDVQPGGFHRSHVD